MCIGLYGMIFRSPLPISKIIEQQGQNFVRVGEGGGAGG